MVSQCKKQLWINQLLFGCLLLFFIWLVIAIRTILYVFLNFLFLVKAIWTLVRGLFNGLWIVKVPTKFFLFHSFSPSKNSGQLLDLCYNNLT